MVFSSWGRQWRAGGPHSQEKLQVEVTAFVLFGRWMGTLSYQVVTVLAIILFEPNKNFPIFLRLAFQVDR